MDWAEEALRSMESGEWDFTSNGACSNCGNCCSNYLPLMVDEIRKIRKYIRKNRIRAQKHFIPTANAQPDVTCPFRDHSGRKCTIYQMRPAICRDFRCDKPSKHIKANMEMYHGEIRLVDMWAEFFGEE